MGDRERKMTDKTRRKYYGRSSVAQSLRSAANELQNAIQISGLPVPDSPLAQSLKKVLKSIQQAIEYENLYQMGRKKIKAQLVREEANLRQLVQQVCDVPVTKDEKIVAKSVRDRNKK